MIRMELMRLTQVLRHPFFEKAKRDARMREFLEELAQIGVRNATIRFSEAEYDGDNDVVVRSPAWIDENTLQIVAEGKSILFIEFGTGVYNPVEHPRADDLGMFRGEYGYGLGKLQAWRYEGEPGTNGEVIQDGPHAGEILTHGNNANMCMYLAAEDMRDAIARTAWEVFTR